MSLSMAFGVGVLTGRAVQPDPPVGLAPVTVVALIDENVEAVNAGSGSRLRATYARDAVLSDMTTGERWFGAIEIVRYISSMPDMSVQRTSAVIYVDGYATYAFRYRGGARVASGVQALRIEKGFIAHQWVMSDEPGGWYVVDHMD